MNDANRAAPNTPPWWQAALLIRGQTDADQHNIRVFSTWCLVTFLSFAAVQAALVKFTQFRGPFAWIIAMIPIVCGIFTVRSFLRFLRGADEFVRKVQLEGIALGFGSGHIFCLGYFLLQYVGAPVLPVVYAVAPLTFGWAIGSLVVAFRYR